MKQTAFHACCSRQCATVTGPDTVGVQHITPARCAGTSCVVRPPQFPLPSLHTRTLHVVTWAKGDSGPRRRGQLMCCWVPWEEDAEGWKAG